MYGMLRLRPLACSLPFSVGSTHQAVMRCSRRAFPLHITCRCLKSSRKEATRSLSNIQEDAGVEKMENIKDSRDYPDDGNLPPLVYHPLLGGSTAAASTADLASLFYDTSIPSNELTGQALTKEDDDGTLHFAQVQRGKMTKEELFRYIDMEELERVKDMVEVPDVHTLPLHRMHSIPESVVRTTQARLIMYRYASYEDFNAMKRTIAGEENRARASIPGNSLYFQFVHPDDVLEAGVVEKTDNAQEPSQKDGSWKGAQMDPTRVPTRKQQELKYVRDTVEKVLRRYVGRMIEPFPNELAIDVTHYATFLPLLTVARRNVTQALKDIEDYLAGRPVTKEGIGAGPPPPLDILPISPDTLAAEIARVIRKELLALEPLQRGSDSVPTDAVEMDLDELGTSLKVPTENAAVSSDSLRSIRVCIGVATTPVLAKIASDAEAAAVRDRLRAFRMRSAPSTMHSDGKEQGKTVPLVSIRSFHRHIRTLKASRDFIASFPVHHLAIFTPAFVQLLRRVFGITRCGDFYKMRFQLFFCLSPETATFCYKVAYGQMQFLGEEDAALVAHENLLSAIGGVEFMASNRISIVNETRTEFNPCLLSITSISFRRPVDTAGVNCVFLPYGRLTPDDVLLQNVDRSIRTCHRGICRKGLTFKGMRIALRAGVRMAASRSVVLQEFPSEEEIVRVARKMMMELLPFRERPISTPGEESQPGFVDIFPTHVGLVQMVPTSMMMEAEHLQKLYLTAKKYFSGVWSKRRDDFMAAHGSDGYCKKSVTAKKRQPGKRNPIKVVQV